MEQPPLIDVEPEDGQKSRLMGCAGCLGKFIPLAAGFMLLSILLMALALFIWGGDLERRGEGEEAGTESVGGEKKGFAGVMDKVKRAVQGQKDTPAGEAEAEEKAQVSGEGGVEGAGAAGGAGQAAAGGDAVGGAVEKSTALAVSVGAEGKSPEERNRLLKEKFGHLEKDRPEKGSGDAMSSRGAPGGGTGDQSGGGDAGMELPPFGEGDAASEEELTEAQRKAREALNSAGAGAGRGAGGSLAKGVKEIPNRRGGSFGSSTGAATVTGTKSQYQRWRGDFSTSGSDLEFEVIYQEAGGQLQFRCFVMPYDSQTARLFRADKGDFLLSFRDENGERLAPAEEDLPVPLTKLTAFEAQGKVSGWVARGMIPLDGQELSNLKSVRLGWDFDKELSDWLKDLKAKRDQ